MFMYLWIEPYNSTCSRLDNYYNSPIETIQRPQVISPTFIQETNWPTSIVASAHLWTHGPRLLPRMRPNAMSC